MAKVVRRFQADFLQSELEILERLGQITNLRTKKEVILNALCFLSWAIREIFYGRTICSVDERTGKVKQYDSPALSVVYELARRGALTQEEIERQMGEPASKSSVVAVVEK